jgi:hypothetical protein
MQLQNIDFLKQFRKEEISLPGEERQYRNIQFRHFSGGRKGRYLLERHLENQIANSELVGRLVVKMETEDLPASRRLTGFMQKLLKTLAVYSRKDCLRSEYLTRVCAEINRFMGAANLYGDKAQSVLLNTLRVVHVESRSGYTGYLGSVDICRFQVMVKQYLDIVYLFHTVFADLLEEELSRTSARPESSPVENALFKLTMLVKSEIFVIESTSKRLGEWKTRSREVEAQEVYN